jgi:hypothetical protein
MKGDIRKRSFPSQALILRRVCVTMVQKVESAHLFPSLCQQVAKVDESSCCIVSILVSKIDNSTKNNGNVPTERVHHGHLNRSVCSGVTRK